MGTGQASIAAATAVVGYDLCTGQLWQRSGRIRALTGISVCGSAAAADTKVILLIGTARIGEFFNTATGFPTKDHRIEQAYLCIPAAEDLHLIVEDAPATNPVNVIVEWIDL